MKKLAKIIAITIIFSALFVALIVYICFNNNRETGDRVYCESIVISFESRVINISLDNFLIFNVVPYKIEPSGYNQGVDVQLLDSRSQPTQDATFNDNIFKASKEGSYLIKFSATKSNGRRMSDTIRIRVSENEEDLEFRPKEKIFKVLENETIDLLDNIECTSANIPEISFYNSDKEPISNIWTAPKSGIPEIYAVANFKEISIVTSFNISIETMINDTDDDNIVVQLNGEEITEGSVVDLDLETKYFIFTVTFNEGSITHFDVKSKNVEIVSILSSSPPIISVSLENIGKTEIVIRNPITSSEFHFFINVI